MHQLIDVSRYTTYLNLVLPVDQNGGIAMLCRRCHNEYLTGFPLHPSLYKPIFMKFQVRIIIINIAKAFHIGLVSSNYYNVHFYAFLQQ